MNSPMLSIAICTYNRAYILGEALTALTEQYASAETFAVIVVDNASADDTQRMIASFRHCFPHFTAVYEPVQGIAQARNAAAKAAGTEWVGFLDDDAKVGPDYVEIALACIRERKYDCFGGAIRAWRRDPLPVWFLDEYEYNENNWREREMTLSPGEFLSGGNMVVRREPFLALGGFDANFGPVGKIIAYGEETEFQVRLHAHGYAMGYVPSLVLYHYARPEKYTFAAQWLIRYKAGISWQMLHRDGSWAALAAITAKLAASPAKGIFVSLRRLCNGTYRWQNAVLEVTSRFLFTIGRLAGWLRLRRAETSSR